jgi:cytochrome c-type biogenesis protein CcmH
MKRMRPRTGALLAVLSLALSLGVPTALATAPATAATPRASLTTIERQVMCVTCKIPLNVAESTQADREREYIQSLIDQGQDEAQIKSALVSQYGPTVLGLPATHGFQLAAYLVPLAVVVTLAALLAMLLPRWRRRAREPALAGAPPETLSAPDAARLDSDMARFD